MQGNIKVLIMIFWTCLHIVSLGICVEGYNQALAVTLLFSLHQLLGGRRLGPEAHLALGASKPSILELLKLL